MEQIIGKLLQDFEHGKMTRRQLIQTLALAATAPSTAGPFGRSPERVDDPRLPITEKKDGKDVTFVRELVKINHHRNCLLCHAPGNTADTPEGVLKVAVPLPGEPYEYLPGSFFSSATSSSRSFAGTFGFTTSTAGGPPKSAMWVKSFTGS